MTSYPKPIKPKKKKPNYKELYYQIWSEREHRCEVCGIPISEPVVHNFAHIRSKGARPDLKMDMGNIRILCSSVNRFDRERGCHCLEHTNPSEFKKRIIRFGISEIWEPIEGYESIYEVSNFGNINSLKTSKMKSVFFPKTNFEYPSVALFNNGRKKELVHRIVAKAFIPNPNGFPEVNHIDGDKNNFNANNLEWVTSSQNTVHSYETGLQLRGEGFYSAKLTENEAIEIINAYRLGVFSQGLIAKSYGISKSSVKDLLSGRNWAHLQIQDSIRLRCDRVAQHTNPSKFKERLSGKGLITIKGVKQ